MLRSMKEYTLRHPIIIIFLGSFTLRLIPEILAGPWPLGFDTIRYYVPTMLDWANGDFNPVHFNYYTPLCYFLLFSVYRVSGSVFFTLKFLGPLLYGLLCSSFLFFVNRGLGWNNKKGLVAAFLFSVYFLTLRISWDLYRNMLGLTFFFLFLPFLRKFDELPRSRKFIASVLAILITLSHEITSVIMFFVIFSGFALDFFKNKRLSKVLKLSLWFMPSLIILSFFVYSSAIMFHEVPGSLNYLATTSYSVLTSDVLILFFLIFGPLLPFAILGFWRDRTLDSWSLICLLGSFWPILYPWFQIIPWKRWMFMLWPPFAIYIVNGFDKLKMLERKFASRNGLHIHLSKLALILIIILGASIAYMVFPLNVTFSPHSTLDARLGHYIPGSMLCNTFPLADCDDFEKCFQYVNKRLNDSSVLIIHESLTGWARLYVNEGKNVINYHSNSPLYGVSEAAGYETIYLIWWVDGYGWYGQKNLPECFESVFNSSYVSVYIYRG